MAHRPARAPGLERRPDAASATILHEPAGVSEAWKGQVRSSSLDTAAAVRLQQSGDTDVVAAPSRMEQAAKSVLRRSLFVPSSRDAGVALVAAPPREGQPDSGDACKPPRIERRASSLRRLPQSRQSRVVSRYRPSARRSTMPRCPRLASCETDVINGRETCVRVGACTRSQRGRRDSLCPEAAVSEPGGCPATLLLLPQGSSAGARRSPCAAAGGRPKRARLGAPRRAGYLL